MGHKVHPNGFRLGVYRNWEAKWFAPDKEYKPLLLEDVRLRRMLMIRLKNAGLARIETERPSSALTITLHTAKPGIVIGKGGTSVDHLRDELEKITGTRVRVTIQEIKNPELAAQLAAEDVAAPVAAAHAGGPAPRRDRGAGRGRAPGPHPAPAAPPPPVSAETPAAKPKRAPRATKAADTGEKPAAKRAPRARATTTEKSDAPKAPRARATKKKE